ncbi:glycosyltransferase family 39 protein [Patescibacteria group bacterium]|nr:glycosyltransferase family 39 protein [Patescibacteria group bacterium]MBU1682988.1 glycosyltransferase family 39 protein [Patescibacteria group bacterium]MBU1935037.1 glycosyltransferase family 39 protein [Patescibacteria group bacterium]
MFKKNLWLIILIVLVVWGGFLRFESLGGQSFWIDEGFSVATATAIQEHGYPLLDSGRTVWRSFPVDYITSVGLYLFDDPQVGGRVFAALAGTLLILVFYFFNFQIFKSRRQAIIATILMAFMTYEIAWSRQARMYIYLQLFMTASLYFYYRFIEDKRILYLLLTLIFAALSIFSHQAGYLVALLILLTTLIDVKELKPFIKWIKKNIKLFIGLTLIFGIFVFALFTVKSGSSLMNAFENVIDSSGMDYSFSYLQFLSLQFGLFFPIGIAGFFMLSWQKKWKYMLAISIGVIVYYLSISFQNKLLHFRYLLPIIPFLLIYIACPIDQLFESIKKRHKAFSIGLGVILVAAMISVGQFNMLAKDAYYLGNTAPQPNWEAGWEWIKNDAGENEIITISTFPMFHDIYIGKEVGEKYFLPFSMTGLPGSYYKKAPYSQAETIGNLDEFKEIEGYVILDDLGYRMLRGQEIKGYLNSLTPVFTDRGAFDITIWKL